MATIIDVAKRAGVGKATVSRVISGNGYVKESTREKVLTAIKELDYIPNESARNLSYNKTNIVAVIVPEIAQSFFAELLTYIEGALSSHGYRMIVCNTGGSQAAEIECMEMLKRRQVDGIIFASHSRDVHDYISIDRPIVALDRILSPQIPYVQADHKTGGQLAAQALLDAGCKCVLQMTDSGTIKAPYTERHVEFERVMKEHGVKCINYNLKWNTFDLSYYEEITTQIIEQYPDVDGIFAVDEVAVAFIINAMKKGFRVPEDYKVVAYDGTKSLNFFQPKLSMIRQPIDKLAEALVDILFRLIAEEQVEEMVNVIPVSLIKGEST